MHGTHGMSNGRGEHGLVPPWENPNSQWQEFKHKLACNRHMTEHLRGCGGLMWVRDGDSNPEVWSALVKQPHTPGAKEH